MPSCHFEEAYCADEKSLYQTWEISRRDAARNDNRLKIKGDIE